MPPQQNEPENAVKHVSGHCLREKGADQTKRRDDQQIAPPFLGCDPKTGHRREGAQRKKRIGIGKPAAVQEHVARQKHGGGKGAQQAIVEYLADEPRQNEANEHGRTDGDQPRRNQNVLFAQYAGRQQDQPGIKTGPSEIVAVERSDDELLVCPHLLGGDWIDRLFADVLQEQQLARTSAVTGRACE